METLAKGKFGDQEILGCVILLILFIQRGVTVPVTIPSLGDTGQG